MAQDEDDDKDELNNPERFYAPDSPPEVEDTAQDMEPEYDASEEIGKEANAAMPIATPSPVDKYQQFMDQYKALQNERASGLKRSALVAGLTGLGQSLAAKNVPNYKPSTEAVYKMGESAANQPVEAFESGQKVQKLGIALEDEKAMRQPDTSISKTYRDYAKKRLGIDLSDDVSAFDVQNLLKMMGRPVQTKFQQMPMVNKTTGEKIMGTFNPTSNTFQDTNGQILDSREWVKDYRAQSFVDPKSQERMGFNAGTGKTSGFLTGPGVNAPIVPQQPGDLTSEKPIQINRSFLNGQQAKQVDHTRDKFIQEVKDDRNSLNANDRVIQVLQSGAELGDMPREVQDQLNRAFGQKGHISDAQLGGLLGKADWRNRVENAVSLGMTGKLTDENRKFLLDVANIIKQQNQSYIDKKSQIYTQNLYNDLKSSPNLSKYKFGPESIKSLLGVEAASNPQSGAQKQVVKKGYNPKTNQTQFIYDDGSKEIVDGQR